MNLKRTLRTHVTGAVNLEDVKQSIRTSIGAPPNAPVRIWIQTYEGGRNEVDDGDLSFSTEWEVSP